MINKPRLLSRPFVDPRRVRRRRVPPLERDASTPGVWVSNGLPMAVDLYWNTGTPPLLYDSTVLPDSSVSTVNQPQTGWTLAAFIDATGASVSSYIDPNGTYWLYCPAPNSLAVPTDSGPVPADTSPVLIGAGVDAQMNVVTREQFWARASQSYSVAPNEVRTLSLIQASGVTSTSSSLETIAAAINGSASVGWASASANISDSLNAASTFQHQVTLMDETTSSVVVQLSGGTSGLVVIYWQLMDRITWWDPPVVYAVDALEADDANFDAAAPIYNPPVPKASVTLGLLPLVPVPWTAPIANDDEQIARPRRARPRKANR